MLTKLNIKNYALIEDIEIDLEKGLTTLTGETGAGKSIILGAISLLTGSRADLNTIKKADKKCVIEAEIDLEKLNLKTYFIENDLEYHKKTIIRREFSKDGKSRAFINDTPAVLLYLKDLMYRMLDVHSQHENLELNKKIYQLQAIDVFGGHQKLLMEYADSYKSFINTRDKLHELQASSKILRENSEFIAFQLNELNDAQLKADEIGELEREQDVLSHAEEIKSNLQFIDSQLNDPESNPVEMLNRVGMLVKKTANHLKDFEEINKRFESLNIELEDLRREIAGCSEKINYDPERIQIIQDRLSLIYKLQQKHKLSDVQGLIELREKLSLELSNIQSLDDRIIQAEQLFESAKKQCQKLANQLSAGRENAKADFESEVGALLKRMGMPESQFKVELMVLTEFKSDGINNIDFLFTANKGMDMAPIGKVASGGELSRLMLSIKATLARRSELPTVIFDEVDAGISGEIAEKMGRIILEMSRNTQVLVITHLPQIAAMGDQQLKVFKDDSGKMSQTRIKKIKGEERVLEIARLLSGEKISNEAIDNAKVLLGDEIHK